MLIVLFISANLFSQKFESLAQTPPMGWNSWNKFGCEVTEAIIKRMADALVSTGLSDRGYEYINIDDCWQIDRDIDGNILADSIKFPSGIKALADYVHSKGLKFGIYSCIGDKTCSGRPGSRGHEYQDARTYADWGIDFLKYDFCYHDKLNAEAAYKTMGDALYATKRPILFSICEWGTTHPWLWARNIGHIWRTSMDLKACTNCIYKEGAPLGWLNILEQQVSLAEYAGPGHWNDPDMLQVGNGNMSFYENRSHFTMWCMLAAPLILGNDISNMSGEILGIISNEEAITINQDPLGKQAYRYITKDDVDIWVKPLSGQRFAIAILNKSKNFSDFHFDWKWRDKCFFADPNDKGEYNIYNVWERRKMGTTETPFENTMKERDVTLLILEKKL